MISPSERFVRYAAVTLLPLGTVSAMVPEAAAVLLAAGALLSTCALLDAALAARFPSTISVQCPSRTRLVRNVQGSIDILIREDKPGKRRIVLGMHLPSAVRSDRTAVHVMTGEGTQMVKISWPVTGIRRGLFPLTRISARVRSPLGLWDRQSVLSCDSEIAVYPNLFQERRNLASHFLNRSSAGSHAQRPVGKGREFEKLRDYVSGDSLSDIHWKASAKRGQLITKEFMIERTREIYVVVDASRLSGRMEKGETRSDPVLEKFIASALLLGMVAQRQGDLFGLLTFDDQIIRFLRAGRGPAHFRACRDALYDLHPSATNPNFGELAAFINLNLRKRALIFILTSLDDQAMAQSFEKDLTLVNRRHLTIVNVLKPPHANPVFTGPPVAFTQEIFERLAGHLVYNDLEELRIKLKGKGMDLHLMGKGSLSTSLVSQYMRVKRRQLL